MQPDELQIKRISYAELREIERFIGMPQPPTYEIVGAGGAKAIKRHNETTLQTQEDLEQWEGYGMALQQFFERRNYFMVGLAVENIDIIPHEWIIESKEKPWVTLPENRHELLGYYVLHAICKSKQESDAIIEHILEDTGIITAEEVSQKAKGFRDEAERDTD